MLKITTDGRKIGLDQRLINPLFPDFEGSKVNACTDKVFMIWGDTRTDRLTQLVFCDFSTPNGKGNKFHDLMTGHDDGWSRHVCDIHQCVADGLPRDIEELRRGAGDEDLWAQEFELKWLDEAHAWLDFELITACEHPGADDPGRYTGQPVYVGIDIAARNDLFVLWVLEKVGDVLWTREIIERRGASFAEQDSLLDGVFRRYRVARVCMDQTGMGEKPVEDARRRYGESRVEGVLFTGPNKLTLATQGKEAFEDRRIRIPEGNSALRADLYKLKKVTGPTGTPRFLADADSAGHADRTWACFLAINAAAGPAEEFAFHRVPERPGRFPMGAW
jgi:phage FluMu gp28-like protein